MSDTTQILPGKVEVAVEITAAIIAALATTASTAVAAAQAAVGKSRYWMIGEVNNATQFDLKSEHTYCLHGKWEKSPPQYIYGYTSLAEKYLKLAQVLFPGTSSLEELTESQVKTLIAAVIKQKDDEINYGILPLESIGAGVEGVAVYDVEGYDLYVSFLLDNPQAGSEKKAGCSIMSKSAFDKGGYQDDLGDLIDHMFKYTTSKCKVTTDSGTVKHDLNGGTLEVFWTTAHDTTFNVSFTE